MFERRHQPLASRRAFAARLGRSLLASLATVAAALGIGVLGYRHLGGFAWIDALLNASMILGGMGPVGELHSDAAKVFASLYALFSGLIFVAAAGILFLPVIHRLLHHFHLESK